MLLGSIFPTSNVFEGKLLFPTLWVSKRRDCFPEHFRIFSSYFTVGSEPKQREKCRRSTSPPTPLNVPLTLKDKAQFRDQINTSILRLLVGPRGSGLYLYTWVALNSYNLGWYSQESHVDVHLGRSRSARWFCPKANSYFYPIGCCRT